MPVTEPLHIEKYSNENVNRDEKKGTIRGRRFVLFSILVLELCEGLAFFGVISNMVLFCTSKLGMNSDDATLVSLVFQGKSKKKNVLGSHYVNKPIQWLLPCPILYMEKWGS